ncbi:MAG: ATP-grasp domain-containing protein [Methanotrichaceae archaeon]|nr:ATP-grasp domain-containing protein [Methanotrichaceae archaeon]
MRHPTDFVECLLLKARQHGASVVIPSHEETYVLAQYRSVLEDEGIAVPVMDHSTILKVHDKAQSVALADELGIPTPRTWYPTKADDITDIARQAEFPVVVKLRKGRGSIGLGYAHSASELSRIFHRSVADFGLGPDRYPLVQEFIDGTGVGVSMLFDQGQLKAQFTHLRLKEFPITGGTSVERVSISFPQAEEHARRILSHLNWHGVAMVEFRVDMETQKPYFLEINPRFWGSLNQAVCSGVDFPYLLYKVALKEHFEPVLEYRLGVRTIWVYGYLRAFLDELRTPARWRGMRDLIRPRRAQLDDFSITDPLPFFAEPLFALKQLITKGKLTFETDDETVKNTPF